MDIVSSIYGLFNSGHCPGVGRTTELGENMTAHVVDAMKERKPGGILRASNLGTKCKRKLWYTVNQPELAEKIEPQAQNKFLFGHLIEEYILFMLEESGHKVEKKQATVSIEGRDALGLPVQVEGHIDCIVDGIITDVKSANSRAMDKFKYHKLEHDDPFGYIDQLDFYRAALIDDPAVSNKNEVQFIAVDKELGHIVVDKYDRSHIKPSDVYGKVQAAIDMCSRTAPPDRGYFAEPDGKSGNLQLTMQCRYCEFKWVCWPSLRKFIYSNGPHFLTLVKREPDVPEEKRPR